MAERRTRRRPPPPVAAPKGHALRWAAGLAVLAAGGLTLVDRLRARRRAAPAVVPVSGRGAPAAPPSAESTAHGYETADTDVRLLAIIMVVSIVLIVGGLAVVFAMYGAFVRTDRAAGLPMTAQQQAPIVPPEPRLQADPLAEIATLRLRQQKELTTTDDADSAQTRPRLPIAQAMDRVVGASFDPQPARPAPAPTPQEGQAR